MRARGWLAHLAVAVLVLAWLLPTLGLLVTSVRDREQIARTGWWLAPLPVEMTFASRIPAGGQRAEGDGHRIEASVFADPALAQRFPGGTGRVTRFGTRGTAPAEYPAGTEAALRGGAGTVSVAADGTARLHAPEPFAGPVTLYVEARVPPRLTAANYATVLGAEGMGRAFANTLAVAVPATVLPVLVAAIAAHALAFMAFPGRGLVLAGVVGLLAVPLHLALVPLLELHGRLGIGQGLAGVWLAHTGFGLPLAIYLLHSQMAALPREIVETARLDGASEFRVFTGIVLPLSFPGLAAFATFQFLWTWNDLLVAKVFLPAGAEAQVMTVRIADDLLGSRGGDWGILAAAAFVSLAVPLAVFLTLQRWLVRGLLAGALK